MRLHVFALLLIAGLLAAPAGAGMVQTATVRLEGKVVLQADHVAVDGEKVSWDDILYLLPDNPERALPRPQRVRLRNGESWSVDLVRLGDGKLVVRSDLFGEKAIDLALVAAIDFAPPPSDPPVRKLRTLYRSKGNPVPGALLALDGETVSLDSPVGKIDLRRDSVTAYVFTDQIIGEAETDEVALIDGTILRGKLEPIAEGLKLEHRIAGTLTLPVRIVRSVVRHAAAMRDLTELPLRMVRTTPLTPGSDTQAARLRVVRGDGATGGGERFIKGIVIEPRTVVRYQLPASAGGKVRLQARLLPIDGARGDVRVKLQAGSATWEKELNAASVPEVLSLELPAGEQLEIEVDFGPAMRFPCGVILAGPHVLLEV